MKKKPLGISAPVVRKRLHHLQFILLNLLGATCQRKQQKRRNRPKCTNLSSNPHLTKHYIAKLNLISQQTKIMHQIRLPTNHSTQRVPSVDVQCPEQPSGYQEVAFVHGQGHFCGRGGKMLPPIHAEGAQRGSSVPGATFRVVVGDFCPQKRYLLWMRRKNVAACPRRRCPAWKFSAWSNLPGTRR